MAADLGYNYINSLYVSCMGYLDFWVLLVMGKAILLLIKIHSQMEWGIS